MEETFKLGRGKKNCFFPFLLELTAKQNEHRVLVTCRCQHESFKGISFPVFTNVFKEAFFVFYRTVAGITKKYLLQEGKYI